VTGAARPAAALDEPVAEAEAEADSEAEAALESEVAAAVALVEVARVAARLDEVGANCAAALHHATCCCSAAKRCWSPGQLL
jgi:hypothetical protein